MAQENNNSSNPLSGVGNTISSGVRAATSKIGSAIGNAIAPVIGGIAGGAIGDWIGKNGKKLAELLGAYLLAQAMAGIAITFLITTVFAIIVIIIMFIINTGAYIVPPGSLSSRPSGGSNPGETVIPSECLNNDQPKPVLAAGDVRFSSDGRYAFPVAPFNTTRYACYHWDRTLNSDIFVSQSPGGPDVRSGGFRPVVAYTSGVIDTAGVDSLGGRIVILSGDDGRHYYYAHNCTLYVEDGQRVTVGEVIATTDTTGSAATTASPIEHVHFTINSQSPNFVGGGDVCPAWDFDNKFGLNRCPGATQTECDNP